MLLALVATALVAIALLSEELIPRLDDAWSRYRARRRMAPALPYDDPGRDRRAEQRARTLLRSCVNEEEWAMYRDLGFIRVWGNQADGPETDRSRADRRRRLRLPHLSPQGDRRLPRPDPPAAQRVLRRLPR